MLKHKIFFFGQLLNEIKRIMNKEINGRFGDKAIS